MGFSFGEKRGKEAGGVCRPCSFVPDGETIALFTDENRGKSHQRKAPRPPLQTTSHPVESAAASNARQVCDIDSKIKKLLSISFAHHQPYRACEHGMPQRASRFDGVDWCHAKSLDAPPTVG